MSWERVREFGSVGLEYVALLVVGLLCMAASLAVGLALCVLIERIYQCVTS